MVPHSILSIGFELAASIQAVSSSSFELEASRGPIGMLSSTTIMSLSSSSPSLSITAVWGGSLGSRLNSLMNCFICANPASRAGRSEKQTVYGIAPVIVRVYSYQNGEELHVNPPFFGQHPPHGSHFACFQS